MGRKGCRVTPMADEALNQVAEQFLRALWVLLQGTQGIKDGPGNYKINEGQKSIIGPPQQILAYDAKRVAVMLSNYGSQPCWLTTKGDTPTLQGIFLQPQAGITRITFDDYKSLVCGPLLVSSTGVGGQVYWIEILKLTGQAGS